MLHPGSGTDVDFVKLRITIGTWYEGRSQGAMTVDDGQPGIGNRFTTS